MAVLPIILLYFFTSEISCYKLKRHEAIGDDWIGYINFDEKGNTYVGGYGSSGIYRLYKLDSSNELIVTIDLPNELNEMLVSKRGDAYIHFFDNLKHNVSYVRAGSTKLEALDRISNWGAYYLDNDDNFFYCKKDAGVHVLRPNSSSGVPIGTLNSCDGFSTKKAASDKSGNVYFAVKRDGKDSIALVSKEALYNETPHASFVFTAANEAERVAGLTVDAGDHLWMMATDFKDSKKNIPEESSIKKYKNGNWENILTEKTRMYREFLRTKDRMYILAKHHGSIMESIFYIAPNDEVVEIPELKNLSTNYFLFEGLVDSEGQAYFYNTKPEFSSSYGMMVTVKPNETKPISISIASSDSTKIVSSKVDFNDGIWMVMNKGDIFHLKKGETNMNVQNDIREGCNFMKGGIDFNFVTKKIYVSCFNGLFIAENI